MVFKPTAPESKRSFDCWTIAEQFRTATHPVWLIAGTKTFLPALADSADFQPLHQPQTVPEILVAGPRESFLARPVNAAEQRIENHVLYLRPVPITEPGP